MLGTLRRNRMTMKHLDYDLPPEGQAKVLRVLNKEVLQPVTMEQKLDKLEIEIFLKNCPIRVILAQILERL